MPKQKITREMVVDAAFALAREGGMERVLVKNIAEKLGCSVQPIYSYCKNMESLRDHVAERARQYVQDYVAARIDQTDIFRSTGRAYVQIAKAEPHILKMFVFQERKNVSSLDDLYRAEANPKMAEIVSRGLGIDILRAKQLHLDMLIYTVGISTIFSVTTPGIPADEIFSRQDRACRVFLKAALEETE